MSYDPGYTPEEIERGENRAWHLGKWGCGVLILVSAIVVGVFWRAVATSTDL
jgi:hypothetical protein